MLRTVIVVDGEEMTERGHYGTSSLKQGIFFRNSLCPGFKRSCAR